MNHLVVVSADRLSLYEYFARQFSDVPGVQVLVDRRNQDRRVHLRNHDMERRAGEGRERLLRRGWFIVARRQMASPTRLLLPLWAQEPRSRSPLYSDVEPWVRAFRLASLLLLGLGVFLSFFMMTTLFQSLLLTR